VRKEHIDIAVIAVPAESAQHARPGGGGRHQGDLEFSPGALKVPAGVKMKGVDLTVSLESLSSLSRPGHRR
jgi:NADH/NAD ratio-sensing transcriptional regulator Rex